MASPSRAPQSMNARLMASKFQAMAVLPQPPIETVAKQQLTKYFLDDTRRLACAFTMERLPFAGVSAVVVDADLVPELVPPRSVPAHHAAAGAGVNNVPVPPVRH